MKNLLKSLILVFLANIAYSDIANDPFITSELQRENFEPSGKYHLFGSPRGEVVNRAGKINIQTVASNRLGNLDIEKAVIIGGISYDTDFSGQGHTWEVHAPFDRSSSSKSSDKKTIPSVSTTAYILNWQGTKNHPADGYDGEQGGIHPVPTGARDEYSYTIQGQADSITFNAEDRTRSFLNVGKAGKYFTENIPKNWNAMTTHNPNLGDWTNKAEIANEGMGIVGNAIGGVGSFVGVPDVINSASELRDKGIIKIAGYLSPKNHIKYADKLIGFDNWKDSTVEDISNWIVENPNAAEWAELGFNVGTTYIGAKTVLPKNAKGLNSPDIPALNEVHRTTSQAINNNSQYGRVGSRINIANGTTSTTPLRNTGEPVSAGFNHILQGHFNVNVANNRSVFTISPSELKSILQSKSVVNSPIISVQDGQYIRIADAGRIIGVSSLREGGLSTRYIKIFTDRAGNLITAYPVKGKK